ncbi:response regulator [Pelotomaculum propionicicum]|uniref:Stage 0 sporulation protein A homolog n=1 Tax=Pelotomaculum propionicicum TaxID=258475 RepID=A0A4Y7RPM4_9FIRM|nr:response regulator [Pelotomaculum propionicicum]NLI13852.1 MinD/ParA family protein [Peptococcaceae bacterium]TEB10945.1 Transcriptional regulatory protein DegU [Pelotomaculum propionicicum]
MSRTNVLVVDDIANMREDIKRLLYFEEDINVVGEASDGKEAVQLAENLKPDVVLMDINLPGMDGIMASEVIVNKMPDTAIVIISIQGEPEYLRKAMAAGARDYLVKPFSGSDLAETIRRVSKSYKIRSAHTPLPPTALTAPEPPQSRRMIVVFSSKGGVGKTTLACNLAVCLGQDYRKKVALVDLNLQGGDVSVMLNLSPRGSIAELVQEEDRMEYSLVNTYLVPHLSGLKVLPAPLRPEQAEVVTAEHVEGILKLLKNNYEYVVIDTSPLFNDLNLVAMEAADDILLTCTRDLPAIRHTKTDMEVLESLNLSGKVKFVLNQSTLDYGIKISDLEKSFNASPAALLPYDEKTVLSSINKGHPFVMTQSNCKLSQSIKLLAGEFEKLSSGSAASVVSKRSFIGKLFSL